MPPPHAGTAAGNPPQRTGRAKGAHRFHQTAQQRRLPQVSRHSLRGIVCPVDLHQAAARTEMKLRPSGQQLPKTRTRRQRHARAFAFLHNHLPKFTACRPAAKLRPSPRPSGRRLPQVGVCIARAPHAATTNVLTEKTKVPTVFSKVLIEISKVLSVFPPPSRRARTCGVLKRVVLP